MVISLNEVASEALLSRAVILVAVAFAITAGVYGVVGLIVKMDDVGLKLAQTRQGGVASFGRGLVRAMPVVLSVLSKVGHRRDALGRRAHPARRLDELGVSFLYDAVHHLEEDVHDALGAVGGVAAWLVNTGASAILGVIVGAIVVAVMHRRHAAAAKH
jgi:predicted DNA repair protein MutK